MTTTTQTVGNQCGIEAQIHMLLQLSWYQFELDCYKFRMLTVILTVTTKKITKNVGKEKRIETVLSKNQLNTHKKGSKHTNYLN